MENQIKSNFEKIISKLNFTNAQKEIKEKNIDNFIKKGFPNKRLEDWKFSDLKQIISNNFEDLNFLNENNTELKKGEIIEDLEANKLIFVNGVLSNVDFKYENLEKIEIEKNADLNEEANQNALLNLNSAFVSNCIKVTIKAGYQFKKPLVLYNYLTEELNSSGINNRLDLDLENDVALDIVNVSNKSSNKNFLNFRQKINIGQNSILKNYSLDINQTDSIKYTHKEINLSKNSHLEYFILSAGSKFLKHDINCSLNSEYGSISLNGIINLNNDQHHEIKTVINHNEENCKSYQLIKSVLNDDSKGVYQGKIFVDPKAQKTDGYQLSRALLLNENVEFNAKPELEIYADDVKCSHGSASGSLNENSIFYLRSRGLNYKEAKNLLIKGFLLDVIEKITDEEIKKFITITMGLSRWISTI